MSPFPWDPGPSLSIPNPPVPILYCVTHNIFPYGLPSYHICLVNLSLSLLQRKLHDGRDLCLSLLTLTGIYSSAWYSGYSTNACWWSEGINEHREMK